MTCPRCQHENRASARFCEECGTPLQRPEGSAQPAPSYADWQRVATEAQEQQAATAEILRVISSSPPDLRPVLDAMAESAARPCAAADASIFRLDGDVLRVVAHDGPIPHPLGFVLPAVRGTVNGRSVLDRQAIQVADLPEAEEFPEGRAFGSNLGFRTVLSVPLLREGVAIGTIALRRTEVRLFTDKQIALLRTFADQAVIAIENVRLFNELEARNRDLMATSDILQVIASSPTDTQPVFDAIARAVVQLCEGLNTYVWLLDGEHYRLVASLNASPDTLAYVQQRFPGLPTRGSTWGRAVLDRAVVHIPDVTVDPEYEHSDVARADNYRSALAAPLLRQGIPIGALTVARRSPFSEKQIELVKTFADQAVIAIENVRLFNETKEALEQQTATSEILRVISNSPTDIQPVLEAVAEAAARLCDSADLNIFRVEEDILHLAVHRGPIESLPPYGDERVSLERGSVVGRSIIERRTMHILDLSTETEEYPEASARARRFGYRTVLSVPLLREGVAIGAIAVRRSEAQFFTKRQVALLQTFADQAVIAIENVRLFNESKEALEQQTATAEILRVISSSPTDVQPVYNSIVERAARLCDAEVSLVARLEGEWIHVGAVFGTSVAGTDAVRRTYPMRPGAAGATARAIRDSAIAHIPDVLTDQEFTIRDAALTAGFRAVLAVPMLREGRAIGAISIGRAEVGEFSTEQVNLLRTFADQAVIAIENVRLFKELEARNRDLTTALDTQTATSDILSVISRSQTDVQPVFDAILGSAVRLLRAQNGTVTRLVGDQIELAALAAHEVASDAAGRAR